MTITGEKTGPKGTMPIVLNPITVMANDVVIERLKFLGTGTTDLAIQTSATASKTADLLEVRDCIFRGISGVLLQGTRWSKVHDCFFDGIVPPVNIGFLSLGFGVAVQGTASNADNGTLFNEIYNNKIQNGQVSDNCVIIGDGVLSTFGTNMFTRVRDNIFRNCGQAGVWIFNLYGDGLTAQATIEHNAIFQIPGGIGVFVPSSTSHVIQKNRFYQLDDGIVLGQSASTEFTEYNSFVNQNRFLNLTGSDIFIDNWGFGNVFDDNEGTYFCDASIKPTSQVLLPNNHFTYPGVCAKRKRGHSDAV